MARRTFATNPFGSSAAGAAAGRLPFAGASPSASDALLATAGDPPVLNSRAPNHSDTPITRQAAIFRNRPIARSLARRLAASETDGISGRVGGFGVGFQGARSSVRSATTR